MVLSFDGNGVALENEDAAERIASNGTLMSISAGTFVRPVLARVIGALAARADFSVDRLSDTILLGDAVSAHDAADFPDDTVWSGFGRGYGFVPLVLPIAGLRWLIHTGRVARKVH